MNRAEFDDNRWQKLKAAFNEAVELTPDLRSSYLSALRLNEKTFYQELAELIAVDGEAAEFLGEPAVDFGSFAQPSLIGATIGHYRIEREIERGGMGAVFEGKRSDGEFEHRVAVKLVNRSFFKDELVRRFKTERQILARLEHPNIVRLLDGGLTGDGAPYYVMEFVEGVPVDVYCRENRLDTNEKLRIFLQICSAVAYAHRQLVVHRDLKPSNILITGNGEAKLLDFGIAKILDADADLQTQTQNAPLTPAYASPEQIKGETITTAADIYSLGVVLYELLTEKTPGEIYGVGQTEIARAICEIEPVAPSRYARQLKGDLDNVVLKSLQKEKERRFDSIEQFADDVESYLNGLPVRAHPQSFRYRAAKFVKRNRLAVFLAATAILLIAVGFVAAVWQSFEARRQQQIAEQRFNQVRKIANSFIFDYHDEIARLDGSTALRERLVSDGVSYLDAIASEENARPDLLKESAIAYRKIGDAQGKPYQANLGKLEDAIISYGKSVALLERAAVIVADDLSIKDELVESYRLLANVQGRGGKKDVAIETLQKAVSLNQELINLDESNTERKISALNLQTSLGDLDYDSAPYERTLEKAEALYQSAPHNANLIYLVKKLCSRAGTFSFYMGKSMRKTGEFEKMEIWNAKALEQTEREIYYTENFPEVINDPRWVFDAYMNRAGILQEVGRSDEALKHLGAADKILRKLKDKNADDREIPMFEIWYSSIKIKILKQQNKFAEALVEAQAALNLAVERTEADPTNIEPISGTLHLANQAAILSSELKKEPQAEHYRRICRKYEKQYKEKYGSDFGYVF